MTSITDKTVMQVLADETGSKSYKAHKYGLDHAERPFIDYSEDNIVWEKTAETNPTKHYVSLGEHARKLLERGEQYLTYFLDGSRRVYKVDDHAYVVSGGRSVIYPIVAGQIGIGCCKREFKKVKPECFKSEIVISVPDIADSDGKAGFFKAMAIKLSNLPVLKRMDIQIKDIIPYSTSSNNSEKFEDRGTAKIQDEMIRCEKEMVADLVKKGMLDSENYLVKDGSLEYRPTKDIISDKRKSMIFKNNYNYVIGVSKSFNPEICRDVSGKPNPGYIAELPLFHRTPVACYKPNYKGYESDIRFAVWYIRLRDKSSTRTAFDGVLKIEKMLVTHDENEYGIDSDLVNLLSALIIRAIQAVLNSTKGKIGRGLDFFEEAFGANIEEFNKILWMPETFIIYRRKYDAKLRDKLSDRYTAHSEDDCDLANEWWDKFQALTPKRKIKAKKIIAMNKFEESDHTCRDKAVLEILSYYQIKKP